ncbi:hypothetical protein B0H17DRAFT_1212372 [Mycena rosella]|uniref:DH domain-containing protein n=1 Tax=Mycena rosella TaxID=1033263 RepID=A0AAD7CSV0_MYCRO|nr:hypothetical protein B0H17DRAFT_1212372 [Mycena rosella]
MSSDQPASGEVTCGMIIRELVETECRYVQRLEILQETTRLLFSNLPPGLIFQRKFLVGLQGTAELPWQEQRWGRHFIRAVGVIPSVGLCID